MQYEEETTHSILLSERERQNVVNDLVKAIVALNGQAEGSYYVGILRELLDLLTHRGQPVNPLPLRY